MRTSIWYRTEEKQPSKSGYYLTYRGWGMGGKSDSDSDHGYLYYYTKTNKWYDSEYEIRAMHPNIVSFVYYWTDADPNGWTDSDPPSVVLMKTKDTQNVTLTHAWQDVVNAIEKYEIIKKLVS